MLRTITFASTMIALAIAAAGCSSHADGAPLAGEPPDDGGGVEDAATFDVHVITTPDRRSLPDRDIRIDPLACASPCDCDGDSYSNGKPGCPATLPLDCDDLDPIVHPGQETLTLVPIPPNAGDWDCDGSVTKQYQVGRCISSVASCDPTSTSGLTTEAGCGVAATYVACFASSPGGGSPQCTGSQTAVVQGCR
jgi:hypothetical protein